MTDLDSIKKTLVNISKGNSILDMLLEFERTLDNVELFSYKNWISGELVEGPDISRYFFTVTIMYPYDLMPDPVGGLRLTKIGAKVHFKKGTFKRPIKVRGPQDWENPETKSAKMIESKIWLVTIKLPIKYINHGLEDLDDIIEKDIQKTNTELDNSFSDDVESASMESPDVDMSAEMNPEMQQGGQV